MSVQRATVKGRLRHWIDGRRRRCKITVDLTPAVDNSTILTHHCATHGVVWTGDRPCPRQGQRVNLP